MNDDARRRWPGGEVALGGLLVLLGILVLLGQALELDVGEVGWPFFVIIPGLGLLGLGLATPGRLGEVLVTVGGVVTMAGLVLLVQNATDRFDTWAYAWTLVFLVGPGIGRWLLGMVRGRRELAASGGEPETEQHPPGCEALHRCAPGSRDPADGRCAAHAAQIEPPRECADQTWTKDTMAMEVEADERRGEAETAR